MAKNRNRDAGHAWEREVINDLKSLYPDAVSSRAESRNLDNKQVDICYTGDYHIQCKNSITKPDYHKILKEMPNDKIQIILHKYTQKADKNFITKGKYAIMHYSDFKILIESLQHYENLVKNKEI